jgi:hypothetical protein
MKKLLIVLAVLLLAAPTMAAEWNFYGNARFATWTTDVDMDVPGGDSDRDTLWDQQGNSRIGAKVKFNDEIGGAFEMSDSFGKRQLYGTYNFGGGQLLIGQTYTPSSSYFYSNSVYNADGDLLGIGQFYVGRVPMIQLKFGNLKLAFVKPNTDNKYTYKSMLDEKDWTVNYPVAGIPAELEGAVGESGPVVSDPDLVEDFTEKYDLDGVGYELVDTETLAYDTDTTFPKIELSYGYKGEMFFVDVFGGYQTYELESEGGPSYDVDAYVVGIGAGLNMGPAYLKAGFHMGENFGNYGQWNQAAGYFGADKFIDKAVIVDGNLEDSDGMGYLGVLGFKANDMLDFQAGYGREETEIGDYEAEITQYYLQATINITKGFFLVPEIGMIEYEEEGVSAEPEVFYAGAKWQINF